jgi:hypothetical protein
LKNPEFYKLGQRPLMTPVMPDRYLEKYKKISGCLIMPEDIPMTIQATV